MYIYLYVHRHHNSPEDMAASLPLPASEMIMATWISRKPKTMKSGLSCCGCIATGNAMW